MKRILLLLCICLHLSALAQSGPDTEFTTSSQITSWAVLPGAHYTFYNILTDSTLPFKQYGSIQPGIDSVFWLKVVIAGNGDYYGNYSLTVEPAARNTFYYYHPGKRQWVTHTTGQLAFERDGTHKGMSTNIPFQPHAVNVVYIRMNLSNIRFHYGAVTPLIRFNEQASVDKRDNDLAQNWIASMAVIICFFLSNLYVYYTFKDRTILYYLVMQIGGMLYLSSYRLMFPAKAFTVSLSRTGVLDMYDINNLVEHAGIMLAMYGIVQLTRFYLNTRRHMPRLDAILKYALIFYLLASVVLIIINCSWFVIENYTVLGDNLFLCLFILTIIYTCIRGYWLKLRASGAFLLANSLPFGLIICITLFHVFVSMDPDQNMWLPNLTITSIAFVFSIALVARTIAIRNDLKAKQLEAQQLSFELREIALQHKMVELENQKISSDIQNEKTRNELLTQKLEANQRELASTTIYMVQKNELLAKLKTEIAELNKAYPGNRQQGMAGIQSILQSSLHMDDDWSRFRLHFEQVHPNFFEDLQTKYPDLTRNEIRLYAYFHINLSTKEIATLLNIAPASVRRAKTRLFKKIGRADLLSPGDDEGQE